MQVKDENTFTEDFQHIIVTAEHNVQCGKHTMTFASPYTCTTTMARESSQACPSLHASWKNTNSEMQKGN